MDLEQRRWIKNREGGLGTEKGDLEQGRWIWNRDGGFGTGKVGQNREAEGGCRTLIRRNTVW